MSIKKVVLPLIISSTLGFGGIGENFEKGGVWIGGDGMALIQNIGDNSEFSIFLSLNQKFYIHDNFYFGFYEGYSRFNEKNAINFGGSAGYTFLASEELSKGPAHTIDFAVGSYFIENSNFLTLTPSYTFEYFLTERFAPYIKIGPDFWLSSEDDLRTDLSFRIGLALHFPTKMRVNIPSK